jgi:hypothetical protein
MAKINIYVNGIGVSMTLNGWHQWQRRLKIWRLQRNGKSTGGTPVSMAAWLASIMKMAEMAWLMWHHLAWRLINLVAAMAISWRNGQQLAMAASCGSESWRGGSCSLSGQPATVSALAAQKQLAQLAAQLAASCSLAVASWCNGGGSVHASASQLAGWPRGMPRGVMAWQRSGGIANVASRRDQSMAAAAAA